MIMNEPNNEAIANTSIFTCTKTFVLNQIFLNIERGEREREKRNNGNIFTDYNHKLCERESYISKRSIHSFTDYKCNYVKLKADYHLGIIEFAFHLNLKYANQERYNFVVF